MTRVVLLGTVLVALGACAGLLGGGDRQSLAIYVLALEAEDAAVDAGECGTIQVSMPAPAPGFATARMVYQREAHRLEPFAYARWAEPLAPMIQSALVSALETSGLFASVVAAPTPFPPALSLDTDSLRVVQRFEGGASHAIVELNVRLVDLEHSRLLATQRLAREIPATADPAGGVAAANRGLAELAAELVELTRRSVDCSAATNASQ